MCVYSASIYIYLYKNEEYQQSKILQITTIKMHFTCQTIRSNISQAHMSIFDTIGYILYHCLIPSYLVMKELD